MRFLSSARRTSRRRSRPCPCAASFRCRPPATAPGSTASHPSAASTPSASPTTCSGTSPPTPEQVLGDRRDGRLDPGGLGVPRGHRRPLLAPRGRLGDERQPRRGARPGGARQGFGCASRHPASSTTRTVAAPTAPTTTSHGSTPRASSAARAARAMAGTTPSPRACSRLSNSRAAGCMPSSTSPTPSTSSASTSTADAAVGSSPVESSTESPARRMSAVSCGDQKCCVAGSGTSSMRPWAKSPRTLSPF